MYFEHTYHINLVFLVLTLNNGLIWSHYCQHWAFFTYRFWSASLVKDNLRDVPEVQSEIEISGLLTLSDFCARGSLREKCPNTEFSLVCIFLYSDWIRRSTLRIQSEYRTIRTRNNAVFGHFLRSAYISALFFSLTS